MGANRLTGILMAEGTLTVKQSLAVGAAVAATMAFVVFSLFVVISGISCHSETQTAFNRNILHDKNRVLLNGLALLFIFLPTELGFLQRGLGLTSLSGTSGCSASAWPSSCSSFTRSSRSSCAAAAGTCGTSSRCSARTGMNTWAVLVFKVSAKCHAP